MSAAADVSPEPIAVAEVVFARGLTRRARPADLAADVRSTMFDPHYEDYV